MSPAKRGGRRSRAKGCRGEREVVDLFESLGFAAKRVPLSGASDGFPGDVVVPALFEQPVEVKRGGNVPVTLYKWLGDGRPVAVVRRDREEWIVVLRWSEFARLVIAIGGDRRAGRATAAGVG